MKLVSVIIPIYKVEKYLEKCVSSVRNQTYNRLEIILVDDGSPDGCGELCEQYKAQDKRIKVIHKENEGLGLARNSGLKIATGEYVIFVDSDDWIEKDAIELMVKHAEEKSADMVICGFKKYIDESHIINVNKVQDIKIYEGYDAILDKVLCPIIGAKAVKGKCDEREMCVWTNLYSMDIIRKYAIEFVSERKYLTEDFFFNIQYILKVKKVVMLPYEFYYYRYNNISLSNGYRSNKLELLQNMMTEAFRFFEKESLSNKIGFRLHRAYIKRLRHCLMQISASAIKRSEKQKKYHEAVNHILTEEIAADYPIKYVPLKEGIMVWLIKKKLIAILMIYLDVQRGMIYMRGYRN